MTDPIPPGMVEVHVREDTETLATVVSRDVDPHQPCLFLLPADVLARVEAAQAELDAATAAVLAAIAGQPDRGEDHPYNAWEA